MKKNAAKSTKLVLSRESIKLLSAARLDAARGAGGKPGDPRPPVFTDCSSCEPSGIIACTLVCNPEPK
jgi:hypothetical protein